VIILSITLSSVIFSPVFGSTPFNMALSLR
jgi:hypothetical protein